MENKLLSIIIPVYNTANYLEQCIQSVLAQTYETFEVIIIDDGSNDGSERICDIYAKIDSRVRVIHKHNEGLVSARKTGLMESKGIYVGFADSDDWIDKEMYQDMIQSMEKDKSDMVAIGYCLENYDKEIFVANYLQDGIYTRETNYEEICSKIMVDFKSGEHGVIPSIACKVFKKELLEKALYPLNDDITYGEDAAVVYPYCLLYAKAISIKNKYWYHYCIREKSMCHALNDNSFNKAITFYKYIRQAFQGTSYFSILEKQMKEYTMIFVNWTLKKEMDMEFVHYYQFPYNKVRYHETIILYGAGRVGQEYYNQIRENNYCEIVAWADKKETKHDIIEIIKPQSISTYLFDKILIAVKNSILAKEIQDELIKLGIDEKKIIWQMPELSNNSYLI